MTERAFVYRLRRGLGSAILELQSNPNRRNYRDAVLRCCLRDISFDTQVEGTKGRYLYTAICALGEQDVFEDILIGAFMRRLPDHLSEQLLDILVCYESAGGKKSKDALCTKMHDLVERLPKQRSFPFQFCEREQLETLMIHAVETGKWSAFQSCVADAGRMILRRGDDGCLFAGEFLWYCENTFGWERVARYLNAAAETSAEVKAFCENVPGGVPQYMRANVGTPAKAKMFAKALNAAPKRQEVNGSSRAEIAMMLKTYVARAEELAQDDFAYGRMWSVGRPLSKQAAPEDLRWLAARAADEQSDEIRANLLRVFWAVDFPGELSALIAYAERGCEHLKIAAVDALARFQDPLVHALALRFIQTGDLDAGLPLLVKNWKKRDEETIRSQLLPTKCVPHSTQWDLRDIYARHRSNACGDILEHVYENGPCAACRFHIVEAMWENRVLNLRVLNECLYNSYEDTRKMAARIKKRLGS